MGIRLILYLSILILGGIIGYKKNLNKKLELNLNRIQNLCLLFLLFIMGLTIGMNDEVMSNLFTIGIKALILTVFSILFSILFVRFIKKFIGLEGEDVES